MSRRRFLQPSPKYFRLDTAKRLVSTGSRFLAISLASIIISSTDNIVITQIFGPKEVTPYSVTFILTQFVLTVIMVILNASWPAYSEAASRGDVDWIRKTHRRLTLLTWILLLGSGAVMALIGRSFIMWWAGPDAVPSQELLLSLIVLSIVQGAFLCVGRLITALGAVQVNAMVGTANAIMNILFSIALAYLFGVIGVALGTVAGYLLSGWVLFPVARRELCRLEKSKELTYWGKNVEQ